VPVPRWGLALSGGGLLGAAHLGVVQALDDMGLRPDVLAGTSAGGLVVGLLALDVPVAALTERARQVVREPWRYFPPSFHGFWDEIRGHGPPASGLLDPRPFLRDLLALAPWASTTADWRRPTATPAVDLVRLRPVAFVRAPVRPPRRGGGWAVVAGAPLEVALHGTMAMPGLYTGVVDGGALYVDGGSADTLPLDWAVALGAQRVLAVDVTPPGRAASPDMDIRQVLQRVQDFSTADAAALRRPRRPVLTLLPDTSGVPFFGFSDFDRLVEAGYAEARRKAPAIRRFLAGGTGVYVRGGG
jgi:NTE family protein